MTEREKVLNDLRELCEYLFHEYKVCYHGDEEDTYNRFLVANNALNLLKEQEHQITELEHCLAVAEDDLRYYTNGNE